MAFEVNFITNRSVEAFVAGLDLPGLGNIMVSEAKAQRERALRAKQAEQQGFRDRFKQFKEMKDFLEQQTLLEQSGDDSETAFVTNTLMGDVKNMYNKVGSFEGAELTKREIDERLQGKLERGDISKKAFDQLSAVSQASFRASNDTLDRVQAGLKNSSVLNKGRIKESKKQIKKMFDAFSSRWATPGGLDSFVKDFANDPDSSGMVFKTGAARTKFDADAKTRAEEMKNKGKTLATAPEIRIATMLAMARKGVLPDDMKAEFNRIFKSVGPGKVDVILQLMMTDTELAKELNISTGGSAEGRTNVTESLVDMMGVMLEQEQGGVVQVGEDLVQGSFNFFAGSLMDSELAQSENAVQQRQLFETELKFAADDDFTFTEKQALGLQLSKSLDSVGNTLVQGGNIVGLQDILTKSNNLLKQLDPSSPEANLIELRMANIIKLSGASSLIQSARSVLGQPAGFTASGFTLPDGLVPFAPIGSPAPSTPAGAVTERVIDTGVTPGESTKAPKGVSQEDLRRQQILREKAASLKLTKGDARDGLLSKNVKLKVASQLGLGFKQFYKAIRGRVNLKAMNVSPVQDLPSNAHFRKNAGITGTKVVRHTMKIPVLTKEKEAEFQEWYARARELGLNAPNGNDIGKNPDSRKNHYDYRSAFIMGADPVLRNGGYMFPPEYMQPTHPNRFMLDANGDLLDVVIGDTIKLSRSQKPKG